MTLKGIEIMLDPHVQKSIQELQIKLNQLKEQIQQLEANVEGCKKYEQEKTITASQRKASRKIQMNALTGILGKKQEIQNIRSQLEALIAEQQ